MEVGNKVRITDGSHAHRMDKYEQCTWIGLCTDVFEVIHIELLKCATKHGVLHDIHIKNLKTGAIYLHSSSMVKRINRRRVLDQVRLMQVLTEEGYVPIGDGFSIERKTWLYFANKMWKCCGEDIDETLHLCGFLFRESWTEEY